MFKTVCMLTLAATLLLGGCREEATVEGERGELTLTKPDDMDLVRGQAAKVNIHIDRDDAEGEVAITFSGLPQGVRVVDADKKIAAGADEATYNLQVADDAALVQNHKATVTAKLGAMSIAQDFMVDVRAPD